MEARTTGWSRTGDEYMCNLKTFQINAHWEYRAIHPKPYNAQNDKSHVNTE